MYWSVDMRLMISTYISSSEITTLQHEAGDHAVEAGTLVSKSFLAGAEGAEVLGCFGDDVVVEVEDDPGGGPFVDGDVEVDLGRGAAGRGCSGWCSRGG